MTPGKNSQTHEDFGDMGSKRESTWRIFSGISLQTMGKKSILKLNIWLGKQYSRDIFLHRIIEQTVFMVLVQQKTFR